MVLLRSISIIPECYSILTTQFLDAVEQLRPPKADWVLLGITKFDWASLDSVGFLLFS